MNGEPGRDNVAIAEPSRRTAATIFKVAAGVLGAPVLRAAVAFYSVPAGQPWRRACDGCGELLRYPWLSRAFAPPGRCPACGRRIAAPGYLVEAAIVVMIAALVAASRPVWETVAFGWWAAWALALAFVDVAVHRLPDRLTYPAAAGTIGLLGVAALVEHNGHVWLRAVLAAAASAFVFAAMTLVLGRRGPGLGDTKLMLSTVAVLGWVSWTAVVSGFLLGFTAQALWAVALLVTRRADRSTHLPLGPFLVGGALASLALLG